MTSHEAEQAVIGAILLDPTRLREVARLVTPADFGAATLGDVYSLMLAKQAAGEAVDALTLWPAIRAHERLSRTIKSAAELHGLVEATPTATNVAYYAAQVAEAGQNRRLETAAARLHQMAGSSTMSAAEKVTAARDELDRIANQAAGNLHAPTLADVLATPDEEVHWVIPGFLARRDRLVLTGGEGLGKTTLMRQMVILAAAGIHPTEFHHMPPCTVLVVDTENSEAQWRWETRGMATKAAKYGQADPRQRIRLHCTGRLNLTNAQDLARVHALLDQHPADVLVIGPIYRLSPRGMNTDEDAAPVIAALDSLRDRPDGPALLMEAHAGHAVGGDGERNMRPRGSSMQLGWPEFGFGLARDAKDDTGTSVLVKRWRGQRIQGRDFPLQLRSGGDWPWMTDGAAGDGWLTLKHQHAISA